MNRPRLFLLAFVLSLAAAAAPAGMGAFAQEERYVVPVGDSLGFGPSNAPVTLVEFVDYQ